MRNKADVVNRLAADVAIPHATCPAGSAGDEGLPMLMFGVGYARMISGSVISKDGEATNEEAG